MPPTPCKAWAEPMMYDRSQVPLLRTAIRAALGDPNVVNVSDHCPGYFGGLGIIITVKPEASDEQVRTPKERITPVLLQSRQPVQWI
jgi:hypothetical protein